MSIEHELLDKLTALPLDCQQQLLQFAELLTQKAKLQPGKPRRSMLGAFADRGVDITEEDIAEARREMWGGFPRETRKFFLLCPEQPGKAELPKWFPRKNPYD